MRWARSGALKALPRCHSTGAAVTLGALARESARLAREPTNFVTT
jgi:hypothetical protein